MPDSWFGCLEEPLLRVTITENPHVLNTIMTPQP
jgi:hypothetical protein